MFLLEVLLSKKMLLHSIQVFKSRQPLQPSAQGVQIPLSLNSSLELHTHFNLFIDKNKTKIKFKKNFFINFDINKKLIF
jgi:hypothetical protein